jgi:formylglycine-generating enzyme required for sulfatase activity
MVDSQRRKTAGLMSVLVAWAFVRQSAGTVTIETVPIGNPGNAPDTRYNDEEFHPNGIGSVGYSFKIGATEVTNAQYVEFLSAVAASDPYGLYRTSMGFDPNGGIVRSGSPGNYSYAVRAPALSGSYPYDNKPVVFVSSGDAMRFANWLHNGQPTSLQDASTTEDGAYTLNGATSVGALAAVTRNAVARWWLPSEDEWYKAAYHQNDGVTGNYWDYATGTNTLPDNNPPSADTGNSANFFDGNPFEPEETDYTTGNSTYTITDTGAYMLSRSPYGTFDQGGNVWEWNETVFDDFFRGTRGGSWVIWIDYLHARVWSAPAPTSEDDAIGFRVATITQPEEFGDYNRDGSMDAADYVTWRKNDGTPTGYQLWRQNFGSSFGTGSVLRTPVPEPSAGLLFCLGAMFLLVSSRTTILRWQNAQVLHGCRQARDREMSG